MFVDRYDTQSDREGGAEASVVGHPAASSGLPRKRRRTDSAPAEVVVEEVAADASAADAQGVKAKKEKKIVLSRFMDEPVEQLADFLGGGVPAIFT